MADRTRVLVTGGEHFGGLEAVRALAAAGYETWAAVADRRTYVSYSRAATGLTVVPDPAADERRFAEALAEAAVRLGIHVLLPGTDVALAAVAAHADTFPSSVALGVTAAERIDRATAKLELAELAATAGFSVPATRVVTRDELAGGRLLDVPFPAVVKPLRSDVADRHGKLVHRHAWRVEDADGLRHAAGELEGRAWLVQQFVEGQLVSVAGVAWDGAVVASVQQVAVRIWPPDCGGSSYAVTIGPAAAAANKVARLVGELGWSGIFQVQFLRRGGDEFLIDFNPRFYGTLVLASTAGLNLPAVWVELLLGRRPETAAGYRVGVRYRAQLNDLRALAARARAGAWPEALRALAPRAGTSHPVFAWRDPLPLVAGWHRLSRKAFAVGRAAVR